jgi:hypothetical protein
MPNYLQSEGESHYGYMTERQAHERSSPEPPKFRDERGTFWLNMHEVSARRGQARQSDGARNGGRRAGGGNAGGNEMGGR